jgi:glutamyl endopeptidase
MRRCTTVLVSGIFIAVAHSNVSAAPLVINDETVIPSFSGTGKRDHALPLRRVDNPLVLSVASNPRKIIGNNDLKPVPDTTKYPFRAVVLITFNEWHDPPNQIHRCTGFFISKDTVATAGHCVSAEDSRKYNPIDTYTIKPAYNGSPVFPPCTARWLATTYGWLIENDVDYDYAAIKLDCSEGLNTGWFGLSAKSSVTADNPPTTAVINGYPGGKVIPNKKKLQYRATGEVVGFGDEMVHYDTDELEGVSGAPVWYRGKSPCVACAFAVNSGSTRLPFRYNWGRLLNGAAKENLVRWARSP